ncbi:hypothetical protein [Amycolatopsis sp. cmx-11-32]|uniref:hypothetical protein n=1 Tax=Amycolatopsis sp. cmx-11-32 TaxID=2785796 RepID=UPI0039E592F2
MATIEEIERRVAEADSARSAKRSATAQQIGELAQHRAVIAKNLSDIERELGDVLAAAGDVINVDELARFTDVAAADLTRWLTARTSPRTTTTTKRKRPPANGKNDTRTKSDAGQRPSLVRAPTDGQASTSHAVGTTSRAGADAPVGVAVAGT